MPTYKLIVEAPQQELDYLIEEKNSGEPSTMYIEGPFLMADKANRNNRVYPMDRMIEEVKRYSTDMIKEYRSLGELNHPTTVEVNPERACHLVTQLNQNDNVWVGKSRILTETPMGKIVYSLIKDGVKLGVSSRALGETTNQGGHNLVNDFRLIAVDVVHDPSVNTAFVNGILESKEWVLGDHGDLEPVYDKLQTNISSMPRHSDDKSSLIADQIKSFIGSL